MVITRNPLLFDRQTWQAQSLIEKFIQPLPALKNCRMPVAFTGENPLPLVAAAAWLAQTQTDGLILTSERLSGGIKEEILSKGYTLVYLSAAEIVPASALATVKPGRVTLLTSGTTGKPKFVEHSWKTLFTMAKVKNLPSFNWLLTYQPGSYAWYQMINLFLFVPGQSLTVTAETNPVAMVEAALQHQVTAISSTPTFWRLAMLQYAPEVLKQIPLQKITLGGERVDQVILDRLKALYPSASLTHIYASSEAGASIVVHDGKEGFPSAWLTSYETPDHEKEGVRIAVHDGMLYIHSAHAHLDNRDFWVATEDSVEIRGDRVIILGRKGKSVINVGGNKFAACSIEQCLLEHPDILWCRVYPIKSPFVGELVGSDVVLKPSAKEVAESHLTDFCMKRLHRDAVPRIWKFLNHIPSTGNLKTELV